MDEKRDTREQAPGEKELAAALEEAAKALCVQREVPEPLWKGMRERQLLGQRSLQSKLRMSGPHKRL